MKLLIPQHPHWITLKFLFNSKCSVSGKNWEIQINVQTPKTEKKMLKWGRVAAKAAGGFAKWVISEASIHSAIARAKDIPRKEKTNEVVSCTVRGIRYSTQKYRSCAHTHTHTLLWQTVRIYEVACEGWLLAIAVYNARPCVVEPRVWHSVSLSTSDTTFYIGAYFLYSHAVLCIYHFVYMYR